MTLIDLDCELYKDYFKCFNRVIVRILAICHKGQFGTRRPFQASESLGTHNADSIIESKVIYYLEQCGFKV